MINFVCVAILFRTCLKIYIICHTKGGKGSYVLYFSYYFIYVASLKIMGILHFLTYHGKYHIDYCYYTFQLRHIPFVPTQYMSALFLEIEVFDLFSSCHI